MTMTSRRRVELALNHEEPDRVPVDLGGSVVTGMHVCTVYALRQKLGLDPPGTPVKVMDTYQMLGEIAPDLLDAVGGDVVCLTGRGTVFGYRKEGWKPWAMPDGTPVLVPDGFNTDPEPNGDLLQYPLGDKSASPSGRMPKDGWYFDVIVRQGPFDEDNPNVEDNLEEYGPISDDELDHFRAEAERLHSQTDKAVLASFGATSFGNIARVPAPQLRDPKGIRDLEEWYMSQLTRPEYLREIFDRQCEIGLADLERVHAAVGEKITAVMVTGTDFGMQTGAMTSPPLYRDLYQPVHRRVNDWIHANTTWKTFIHSCGSVRELLDDFIDAGFDILNPVQCSACGMDPRELKEEYGRRIAFWGGGVDTQKTLPFGTPDEVEAEVRDRIAAFGPGGGFIFNPVHNVQALTPVENLTRMYETVRRAGGYPL